MKRQQQCNDGIFHVLTHNWDLASVFLFSNAINAHQDLKIMLLFQPLSLKDDSKFWGEIRKDVHLSYSLSTDMFAWIMKINSANQ